VGAPRGLFAPYNLSPHKSISQPLQYNCHKRCDFGSKLTRNYLATGLCLDPLMELTALPYMDLRGGPGKGGYWGRKKGGLNGGREGGRKEGVVG